jgi:hypothetical protein
MDLLPYRDRWPEDDPHANFKAEVACYTAADPLPTLQNLSQTTSGSEALLALDPIVFRQMRDQVRQAEKQGSDEARLKAYQALREILAWLLQGERGAGAEGGEGIVIAGQETGTPTEASIKTGGVET